MNKNFVGRAIRLWLVALIAVSFAAADEQSISGTVTGRAGGPLKGAVVQLKNMKTLAVSSRITDAEGKYRFSSLRTPAHYTDYQIYAVYKGKASKLKRVQWSKSGQETIVNLRIDDVER